MSRSVASGKKTRQILEEALTCADLQVPDWSQEEYYTFAERTMQEYAHLQKSDMHLNYKNVLKAAIAQVMDQIRPRTCLPHDGNKKEANDTLLPILVQVIIASNGLRSC